MRVLAISAVLLGSALAVAACGSSGSGSSTSSSSSASPTGSQSSTASPTTSSPPTSSSPTPTPAFRSVGAGLVRPGFQNVAASDALGDVIVGAVQMTSVATGVDVGLVFSTDAGETWAWGGTLEIPGQQTPRGIMLTPQGAIVVGETRAGEADPKAFIAAAAAPSFDLVEVEMPKEFAGPVSLRDIVLTKGQWVVVGLGKDESGFATLLWRSSDEGATWRRSVIALREVMAPAAMVVGPDGAWNVVGATQNSAAWARSEDQGASWAFIQPKAFSDGDNATQFTMNADGVVAVLGSEGSQVAIWASNAQGVMARVPLPDPSVRSVFFQDGTLVTAGAPQDARIQFWSLISGTWQGGASIEGTSAGISLDQLVGYESTVIVLGSTWSAPDERSIAIWKGTLLPPV